MSNYKNVIIDLVVDLDGAIVARECYTDTPAPYRLKIRYANWRDALNNMRHFPEDWTFRVLVPRA